MKRKILIFALCCIMLFGVFSVSAFADEEVITDLTGKSFTFIKFDSNSGFIGHYNVSGSFTYVQVGGTVISNTFDKLHVAYVEPARSDSGWLCFSIGEEFQSVRCSDMQSLDITFNGGLDTGNATLISWVLEKSVKHEHTLTSVITPPTHTEKGYTTFTCSDCGETYKDNYVDPLGHTFTESTVGATCTSKGYTTYTCDCGYTYTEEGAAYGHTFTTTTVDPTCTKKGSITYVCDCGYSYSEDIPTLPHTYSSSVVDPTCSRKGYTMYTCECGYSYRDNYVDTIPHVFEGTRCSVCNALDPTYVIKSKDFSNVFVRLSEQIKVNTVVGVLGVAAAACVGLVFLWWGGRKLVRALMAAFKKGKISL